jgi:hypothetical protein
MFLIFLILLFVGEWDWCLKIEFHTCKAGPLSLEPPLQLILLFLLIYLFGDSVSNPPDLGLQEGRIIGMSLWCSGASVVF